MGTGLVLAGDTEERLLVFLFLGLILILEILGFDFIWIIISVATPSFDLCRL